MNATFALNLISAVVGKKVNVELDKDFLNLLDIAYSERIRGLERTALTMRFGQERLWSSAQIASQLGISKDYAKTLIDNGVSRAASCLNLNYFKDSPESQRNLCYYFYELLEPVFAYSQQIHERANQIHKFASFDLNENDPFSSESLPDIKKTAYYTILLDKFCTLDIANYPEEQLGCLCFLMAETERMRSSFLPCLINREINCAKAERAVPLKSWHARSFTATELEMDVRDVVEGDACADAFFDKHPKVKDFLAYEAAELAAKIGNDNVKIIQEALITLSNGVWKGYNQFWERYYSWDK